VNALQLIAAAKVNLTLEVLRRRDDGYHEVATVMQTIDLADRVWLTLGPDIELVVTGPADSGVPDDRQMNLAHRAARLLQEEAGAPDRGARIELEKHIPAGAGLGGGSSDAAAVLRGLNHLWALGIDTPALSKLAACLGSDVPFFLRGGTALATGHGEVVEPLPDLPATDLTLFVLDADVADKTRRMYASLSDEDFTDGERTHEVVKAIRASSTLEPGSFYNAFDRRVATVAPEAADAMQRCRDAGLPVTLCGAGPSFFSSRYVAGVPDALVQELGAKWGVRPLRARTLTAAESQAMREA
jgi:4-diphosphocytidyl-2-C-methyl-D-erythritol kinase